ncbi:flavin reductase family protein [Alicyclobacillus sp. ALC3]|uniref:flavin reductase family protein n=1 Tax=Alicyclobacillus sp. ALC3 TaxID=2796143 RepID=UPI0023796E04|nr:flavin reductase family protein [Alicyclobacillus sp. ALC3]WDL97631.1 flavin reductase family protein [Alicyclobacillus sp. ALC3]
MDPRQFRNIAGAFATGVTVVTAINSAGKPVGMTVNSFTALSLDPPLVLVTVAQSASLFDDFTNVHGFAVNILTDQQESLSRTFAAKDIDRFAGLSYQSGVTSSPILPDVLGYFDCEVYDRIPCGDHMILVGHVVYGQITEGDPLLFVRGKYLTAVRS